MTWWLMQVSRWITCPHCGKKVVWEITGNEDTDSVTILFIHDEEPDGE